MLSGTSIVQVSGNSWIIGIAISFCASIFAAGGAGFADLSLGDLGERVGQHVAAMMGVAEVFVVFRLPVLAELIDPPIELGEIVRRLEALQPLVIGFHEALGHLAEVAFGDSG